MLGDFQNSDQRKFPHQQHWYYPDYPILPWIFASLISSFTHTFKSQITISAIINSLISSP